ncbi:MAG: chitobiase/beta-hexosaminidase C-terminal domain-containing protein [Candidatus Pacebacteria bacterium]|nr:chitobiase/beta-hexosaminidase C-terminal domain-containing protein [Candidatus Paceibacterota bacterium]
MKLKLSIIFIALFLFAGTVLAVETDWQGLDPNIGSGTLPNGVVVLAPTSSVATGTYNSQRTIQLTAANSNTIRYTLDGSAPACPATGTLYAGTFTVNATQTLKAIACYQSNNSIASTTSIYTYTFACAVPTIANGTVTAYPACAASCNAGYTLSGGACVANTTGGGNIGGGGGGGGGSTSNFTPLTTPTGGFSVKINNNDARTLTRTVTLTLNGGVDAKNMAIVNGENFTNASQETYATTKQWTLTQGEEMKKVCVRFYSQSGYYTSAVCDEIAYGANTIIPPSSQTPPSSNNAPSNNNQSSPILLSREILLQILIRLIYLKFGIVITI